MNTQYDFAFSFAGENRKLVEEIKNGLSGYKIFYDKDYQFELCGKDLYTHLRSLYMNQSKYVVCFLSKYYKQKIWTNLEFTAVKERLMATFFASDFLIPIVLDEEVFFEDIPSFIGSYKHINTQETIALLKSKYEQSLNEDFFLDNVTHFSKFLLHELRSRLISKGIKTEMGDNYIKLIINFNEKVFYLLPEDFLNLPCLLLHENKKENSPSAIITWRRGERILFSWTPFTVLYEKLYENISLDQLLREMEIFLIRDER